MQAVKFSRRLFWEVYCLQRYRKWLEVKSIEAEIRGSLLLKADVDDFSSDYHAAQTSAPYLGWTRLVIKVLSINMAAGDLLIPLHRRISLFVPFSSFEVLLRAAWMWESWTSLDLKTSRRTHLSNCASTSQMSRSSFTSTSTSLPWNRWVWHMARG